MQIENVKIVRFGKSTLLLLKTYFIAHTSNDEAVHVSILLICDNVQHCLPPTPIIEIEWSAP